MESGQRLDTPPARWEEPTWGQRSGGESGPGAALSLHPRGRGAEAGKEKGSGQRDRKGRRAVTGIQQRSFRGRAAVAAAGGQVKQACKCPLGGHTGDLADLPESSPVGEDTG